MAITYLRGDATKPEGTGPRVIAHICNDIGAWGRGFVMAISARWDGPKKQYLDWIKNGASLGEIQIVQIEDNLYIAHMIAQHDIRATNGVPPIRYDALRRCLGSLATEAIKLKASIHMPRIGCGLAGGNWETIEPIIQETLRDATVCVYDIDTSVQARLF